jgi:hypothetical protein
VCLTQRIRAAWRRERKAAFERKEEERGASWRLAPAVQNPPVPFFAQKPGAIANGLPNQ